MDRSLILPLSIAAALHAGVLFGFNRGKPPVVKPAIVPVVEIVAPTLKDDEPPPEDPIPQDKSAPPDAPQVQRSPEPPATPNPADFVMKPVPAVDSKEQIASLSHVDFTAGQRIGEGVEIFRPGMLDNPPRARVQISPPYPPEARRLGLNGKVLVEFLVDETGRVLDPRIVSSSNPVFDETTVRTVTRWRFEPGKKGGRAVRFRMALPLEFNLNDN
jgi:protein TonB